MELMRILHRTKEEIGAMPLPEFRELVKYYGDPKAYIKEKLVSKSEAKSRLEQIKKANMEFQEKISQKEEKR